VPVEVPPSRWRFPDPAEADEAGVVGLGADLEPATLLEAYRRGLFPMPLHRDGPMAWWSPDPRAVLPLDGMRVSRSLRRSCARYEIRIDTAFADVVDGCSHPARPGGWITADIRRAYTRLHELGWAHSVEVWDGEELVGGLYGVQVGGVFTGESMFHRVSDASKVALVDLAARLGDAGGSLIDVQITTDHLATMGAADMPRSRFLRRLLDLRDDDVRMATDRRPAARLAPPGDRGGRA
jgi:leucyl/phenylalanyl-tRNA--protein transferase